MNEEQRAHAMREVKKIKDIELLRPQKVCCSCGEDLTGHDEVCPVAVKKTMCARCFWQSLGFGKEEK